MLTGRDVVDYILKNEGISAYEIQNIRMPKEYKDDKDMIYYGQCKYKDKGKTILELTEQCYEGSEAEQITMGANIAGTFMVCLEDLEGYKKQQRVEKINDWITNLIFVINIAYNIFFDLSVYTLLVFASSALIYLYYSCQHIKLLREQDIQINEKGLSMLEKYLKPMLESSADERCADTLMGVIRSYHENTLNKSVELRGKGIKIAVHTIILCAFSFIASIQYFKVAFLR